MASRLPVRATWLLLKCPNGAADRGLRPGPASVTVEVRWGETKLRANESSGSPGSEDELAGVVWQALVTVSRSAMS